MAATTSRLVQLIDWYRSEHPDVTDAEMARRLGVSRANLSQWRSAGIRGWPARSTLVALAEAIGRPYGEVLDAALVDTGYADAAPHPLDSTALHAEAIRVLSEAARITYQPRRRGADGSWVVDELAQPQRADWAEFVTTAVTAAAANAGGSDAALAGRPGSWEADLVRQIVESSVGDDDRLLQDWRTEPIEILINPEQILNDTRSRYSHAVSEAESELARRAREISPSQVYIDPDAPNADERRRAFEDLVGYEIIEGTPPPPGLAPDEGIAPAPDLSPEEQAGQDALDAIYELEERLEEQTKSELAAYGHALADAIRRHTAALPVRAPVIVTITDSWDHWDYESVLPRHIAAAITDAIIETEWPDTLPGTPLSRVESQPRR